MRYPVTIIPDDGQFTVTFPDVPEAVTYGASREEALRRAPDALLTIFDAFMRDRRDIPSPSFEGDEAIDIPAIDTAKIELYRTMRTQRVNKTQLAKRLDWHLPQVDRVLNVRHASQLQQIESAFAALGKRVVLTIEDGGGGSARRTPRPGRGESRSSTHRADVVRRRRVPAAMGASRSRGTK